MLKHTLAVAANCSVDAGCMMIRWMCCDSIFSRQAVTVKWKETILPMGTWPSSAVSVPGYVLSLLLSFTVAREETRPVEVLTLCCDFFLPGGGAGTAGFTLPEFWTFAVNRKCSGNGCNTDLCRFTSWFGLLRHPPALCGQGKKDWYHLPSCFPHELPYVQCPLLAYLQGSTTWRPSSCTVTAPSTGTVKTPDTFNPALFTETFTGWESSVEPCKTQCHGMPGAISWHGRAHRFTKISIVPKKCFLLALLLHALHVSVCTLARISRISTHAFWRDFCMCSFCRLTCVVLQHILTHLILFCTNFTGVRVTITVSLISQLHKTDIATSRDLETLVVLLCFSPWLQLYRPGIHIKIFYAFHSFLASEIWEFKVFPIALYQFNNILDLSKGGGRAHATLKIYICISDISCTQPLNKRHLNNKIWGFKDVNTLCRVTQCATRYPFLLKCIEIF